VVLSGGYDEAGDTGRHRVRAGDVIFHRAFESHLDLFHGPGAEVLVVPLPGRWNGETLMRVPDPDAVVRACERDEGEALDLLALSTPAEHVEHADWPDALAEALRAEPSLSLDSWAEDTGLHPGSLSRGFALVFGVTPARYRLIQRAHRAIEAVTSTELPLSRIALDCGFSDQAHMTRAVAGLTGLSPALLRRSHASTRSL
jgi:AraC-like DNA-binding protein